MNYPLVNQHYYGKPPFLMGKLTMSMAISAMLNFQREFRPVGGELMVYDIGFTLWYFNIAMENDHRNSVFYH